MKSPLRCGLFVRRSLPNKVLLLINFLYSFKRKKNIPRIPRTPKKILLCAIANFGDVVISTNVLPVIKKHFPECEIGFLAASAVGTAVLSYQPLITKVHCIDHWVLHRRTKGLCKAILQYLAQVRKLCKEIKACQYDLAIDLYSYFPNAIPLLAKSQIPVRIGYPTGGFSNLLTHPVEWNFADRYVGYAHLHLLKTLGIDVRNESPLPSYDLKKSKSERIVIHMGSSDMLKEWEADRWIQLIQRLEKLGWKICLTGKGEREKKLCDQVSSQTFAENLCDRLNWIAFVTSIQEARLIITIDSVAAHIAAGSLTPAVIIFSGINSSAMWRPPYPLCKSLKSPLSCCPCFNKKGCSTMKCIKGITVDEVYRQICILDSIAVTD